MWKQGMGWVGTWCRQAFSCFGLGLLSHALRTIPSRSHLEEKVSLLNIHKIKWKPVFKWWGWKGIGSLPVTGGKGSMQAPS